MKNILSILFCLLTLSLFAQDNSTPKEMSRWRIELYENAGMVNKGWRFSPREIFTLKIGSTIEYAISKRISVLSGVEFYSTKDAFGGEYNCGCFGPCEYEYGYRKDNYNYLSVPLDVKYAFWVGGKMSLFISSGAQYDFLWGSYHQEYVKWDGTVSKFDKEFDFQRDQLFLKTSLGALIKVGKNTNITMAPNLLLNTVGLISFWGGKVGLQYSFSKR